MTGYTRQSSAQIINGADITAPPLNAEFNKLRDSFDGVTGHSHDGSAGNSPKIDLATSVSGTLPAVHGGSGGKNNFAATSTPVATDDSSQGYAIGSFWYNTSTAKLYVLTDATASSAVWKEFFLASSSGALTNINIDSGTIDGTTIGATTRAAGSFTTISANALATLPVVDIDNGTLDNVVIGASTPNLITGTTITANNGFSGNLTGNVTGNVTGNLTGDVTGNVTGNITSSGSSSFTTIDVNGGAIDGATIGSTSASTIAGTVITANTNFAGPLTGNVTGNVTGNLSGNVTGNVTGDLTGNVTANSGTTTLTNLVVNGTADFTSTTLDNLTDPTSNQQAATKKYVDDEISSLVGGAGAALDTLGEIATALGNDAALNTTLTNSIATKLPLAGGNMTGDIVLGTSKATSTATPATADTLTRKGYVDTQVATKLNTSGGTMSGAIAMGSNKITGLGTPSNTADATTKGYVDGIFGSATSAAASAATAQQHRDDAQKLAINGANQQFTLQNGTQGYSALHYNSLAQTAATNAETAFDNFDDRYLGSKSSAPSVDNDGNALLTGSLYWNSTTNKLNVYSGSTWEEVAATASRTVTNFNVTSTGNITLNGSSSPVALPAYTVGLLDVYLNGIKLVVGTDVTASNGTSISINGVTSGDVIQTVALSSYNAANLGTAASKNVGISNDEIPVFTSGAVTGDYLKINGTSIEGKDIAEIKTELGISATGATLIDDANVSDMRTTLGLGTMATETATNYAQLSGATFSGEIFCNGGINETHNNAALSNNNATMTLDCHNGNNFSVALLADVTAIVIQNLPASGNAFFFTLKLTQNASADKTITWTSTTDGSGGTLNFRWHGGTLPTLSTGGAKTDVFCFYTIDAGQNIYSFVAGQNMS